jgi:heterodisulfide reductase subunit C
MQNEQTIEFSYTFKFPDGAEKSFDVRLDAETGESLLPIPAELPDWTLLDCNRCSHCPLNSVEHPRCPAAVSIIDVIETFREVASIQPVEVHVTSPQRQTSKDGVPLPAAMGALIGARLAASGCPITAKFQPMVRHHLPFATFEEAAYRMVSMHALAQLLRMKAGLEPDWELKELNQLCEDVNTLNMDFARRLRDLHVNDSTTNALSGLDSFVQMVDLSVDDDLLDNLKKLFSAHLEA